MPRKMLAILCVALFALFASFAAAPSASGGSLGSGASAGGFKAAGSSSGTPLGATQTGLPEGALDSDGIGSSKVTLSIKAGYGLLNTSLRDVSVVVDGTSYSVDYDYISRGISFGAEVGVRAGRNLSVFFEGEYVVVESVEVKASVDGSSFSNKIKRKDFSGSKIFGMKFGGGVLADVYRSNGFLIQAGGGIALDFLIDKPSSGDRQTFFGAGLSPKIKGSYFFNRNVGIFLDFQPDIILYSKAKVNAVSTEGISAKLDGSNACFRFAPSVTAGMSVLF